MEKQITTVVIECDGDLRHLKLSASADFKILRVAEGDALERLDLVNDMVKSISKHIKDSKLIPDELMASIRADMAKELL